MQYMLQGASIKRVICEIMLASIVGPVGPIAPYITSWHTKIGCQVMSGYYRIFFCVLTVHPIAHTDPTIEANIISQIPLFFRHPVPLY